MILTPAGHEIWDAAELASAEVATEEELATSPLWTDQRHNLASVLRLW
jgi:hypothetical protein